MEPGPDDDHETDGESLFGDGSDDPVFERDPSDGERRRRQRRLLLGLIGAGSVVIVVLSVVGFVLVRHFVSDATSTPSIISAKYQRVYRNCVHDGGTAAACAATAQRGCVGEPEWERWSQDERRLLAEITKVCRFGPDRTG